MATQTAVATVEPVPPGVPMGIQDELAAELKDAMKSKDRARTSVIRQIETEALARMAASLDDPKAAAALLRR